MTVNKASEGDGISVELFQILKMMPFKYCTQYANKFSREQRSAKCQFSFQSQRKAIPKNGNAKECSDDHTMALISHASKVLLKILQARLQQYVNHELPNVQAGFRGTRDQIANIRWIMEKARVPEKHLFLLY